MQVIELGLVGVGERESDMHFSADSGEFSGYPTIYQENT